MPTPSTSSAIWLVIPAWCESARLDAFAARLFPALAASGLPVTVQIVDDGSPADVAAALALRCETWQAQWPWVRLLHRLSVNTGKGAAIYAGWDLAESAAWLGFCDADGSIDADEVVRLLHETNATRGPTCVCASRHIKGADAIWNSWRRCALSHLFAAWIRWSTRLPIRDSQCGAKIIPCEIYRKVRSTLTEKRFAFDAELLQSCLRAGASIQELPIRWRWQPGSRLKLGRDGLAMLWSIFRLSRSSP
jgi:glycosyltransferase involved in cell wall biosynthesis